MYNSTVDTPMPFYPSISTGTSVPIFRQVVDQVRLALATGQLKPGEQLPSVRELAQRLLVNPNTVAKAYGELLRDQVVLSHKGRGVFVADRRQIYSDAECARRIAPLLAAFVNEAISLGFGPDQIIKAVQHQIEKLKVPRE